MDYPKELIRKIYIDWIKCKIESDKPDDIIVNSIKNKLKQQSDSYSTKHKPSSHNFVEAMEQYK